MRLQELRFLSPVLEQVWHDKDPYRFKAVWMTPFSKGDNNKIAKIH